MCRGTKCKLSDGCKPHSSIIISLENMYRDKKLHGEEKQTANVIQRHLAREK